MSRQSTDDYLFKGRARGRSWNQIRAGRIKRQPCVICGATPAQAHHKDYNKPLELTWLCRYHHKRLHGIIRKLFAAKPLPIVVNQCPSPPHLGVA